MPFKRQGAPVRSSAGKPEAYASAEERAGEDDGSYRRPNRDLSGALGCLDVDSDRRKCRRDGLADVFGRADARGLELAGGPGAGIVHELGGSGLRRLGLLFDRAPARFDLCDEAIGSHVGNALDQAAQVLSK